jgi:general secretion pathway protein D
MKWLCFALLWCCASVFAAPLSLDFKMVNVGQVVQLVYAEALKQPYMIHPDVLADPRMVSFRYEAANGDVRVFMQNFLDTLGCSVVTKAGVDYIIKKLPAEKSEVAVPELETFLYKPKFRDVGYIGRVLAPLFKGSFAANHSVAAPDAAKVTRDVPAGSAASYIDQNADVLIFTGTAKEVALLQKLLPQIDDRKGEVMVRGVVYEVSSSDKQGSAVAMALNILGGKFSIVNGSAAALDSFVRLKTANIDAVFSALSSDSRFNIVSRANLRVVSGKTGHVSSGQEVPVLGSVAYKGQAGEPVQDVQYRSAGMIFDLLPVIRGGVVELEIMQQISDFVVTTTGVNGSPTLNKREVKTNLTLDDGDVIVLGGLSTDKHSDTHTGLSFLPSFMQTKGNEVSKTEILLVVQLQKI